MATTVKTGPRRGDPIYGDKFDEWADKEDQLQALMDSRVSEDASVIWERGFFQAPWSNDEFLISKDHAKLMTAIQDVAGVFPNDIETIRQTMGYKSLSNTKTLVLAVVRKGLVVENGEWLSLTEYGRDLLDEIENPAGDFYIAA